VASRGGKSQLEKGSRIKKRRKKRREAWERDSGWKMEIEERETRVRGR